MCWQYDPEKRPTFDKCSRYLAEVMHTGKSKINLNGDSERAYEHLDATNNIQPGQSYYDYNSGSGLDYLSINKNQPYINATAFSKLNVKDYENANPAFEMYEHYCRPIN